MRRVIILCLLGLFFFVLSFLVAYKLFSLPQMKQMSDLVNLIH